MDPISLLIGMGAGAVGSLLMWLVVGRKLIIKYAGESVINAINEPDDAVKTAFGNLMTMAWEWFVTPSIQTGKEDDEGKPEVISPFTNMARELGRYLQLRISGALGIDKKKKQALESAIQKDLMENPDLAQNLQMLLPHAYELAIKKGDYAPLLIQMIAPALQKFINGKNNANISTGW